MIIYFRGKQYNDNLDISDPISYVDNLIINDSNYYKYKNIKYFASSKEDRIAAFILLKHFWRLPIWTKNYTIEQIEKQDPYNISKVVGLDGISCPNIATFSIAKSDDHITGIDNLYKEVSKSSSYFFVNDIWLKP